VNEWDKQEEQRKLARVNLGRLTFDCYNLKVDDKRAVCSLGYRLSLARDGGMDLADVLNGKTSGTCIDCKEFDGGE